MSPDSMTVRLKRIRVVKVVADLNERLEVVVSDLRSVVTCPFCGLKTSKVHDTRRVKIKDLPVLGAKTTLIWLRRRFSCDNCGGRHLETHPAFEGKMTQRLARAIVRDARQLSITEITRRYGFAWSTVMALVGDLVRARRHPPQKPALQGAAHRRDEPEKKTSLCNRAGQRRDRRGARCRRASQCQRPASLSRPARTPLENVN